MSEFSYYTPLREHRVPTWSLLFKAGVIFQIKEELPSPHMHKACTHTNTTSSFRIEYCSKSHFYIQSQTDGKVCVYIFTDSGSAEGR